MKNRVNSMKMWAVLLLATLCGGLLGARAEAQTKKYTVIGDSISVGYYADAAPLGDGTYAHGFAAQVRDELIATRGYDGASYHNRSVAGATTTNTFSPSDPTKGIVENQLVAAVADNPDLVTLTVGGNDVKNFALAFGSATTGSNTATFTAAFSSGINTILSGLRNNAPNRFIFLTNVPKLWLLPAVYSLFPGADVAAKQAAAQAGLSGYITAANNAISSAATTNSATVIDLYSNTSVTDPSNIASDGFHPNRNGHDALAQAFLSAMKKVPAVPSLVVNVLTDHDDGVCGSTDCTLREAIVAANSDGVDSTITFDPTVFATQQTITVTGSRLADVTGNIAITGPAVGVVLNGNLGGVLVRFTGTTTKLDNLIFTAPVDGSGHEGFHNFNGTATVTNCAFLNLSGSFSVGIHNFGTLVATDCTFDGKRQGIDNGGTATLNRCTFTGHDTGIGNGTDRTVTATNCTFANNKYGVSNLGISTLVNCTVSGNTSYGIYNNLSTSTVTLKNSIVAGNAVNTQGAIVDGGSNITSGTAAQAGLDPDGLKNNGGLTQTIALLSGSPAINAANDANAPATDQRSVARPQGAHSDIGAYEFQETSGLIVNTLSDTTDASDSLTSLREAIAYANGKAGNDAITFSVTGTIRLTSTLPSIVDVNAAGKLTITGPSGGITISGDANNSGTNDSGDVRLFNLDTGADLSLDTLTLSGGRVENGSGGAIQNNNGTVNIANSTLSGNYSSNSGGAIQNGAGTLTITNSTLSGNSANDFGGAINNDGGTLSITGSTLSDNSADQFGGAILNSGLLTITNSTLSGNSAFYGGAIENVQATVTITSSTLSGNSAVYGGAIDNYNDLGTVNLTNSIVAGNNAPNGANINSTTVNGSNNITSGTANEAGLDPAGLQDNGGPTKTIALVAGSPAIDAANDAAAPATDQRGVTRPQGAHSDIGALEFNKYLTVGIAPTFSDTFAENAGAGATQVRITRGGDLAGALTINLRSSDTTEAAITGSATIVAGQSYVDVPVNAVDDTLVDGTQSVLIKATAVGYLNQKVTLNVTDNETVQYNLSLRLLPSAFSEAKTGTAATLVVQHNRTSVATAVDVNLSSSDARLNLPNSVQIPEGKRSVEVAVTVTADNILTGTKSATITADATNFRAANTTATIYDAQARITLSLAPSQSNTISEGNTNNQTVLRVTRNTPSTGDLVVNLSLNKGAGQVSYPSNVTIPDGAAYADFTVSAIDDSEVDGTQSVVVKAEAAGYGSSTAQLYVRDNDGSATMSAFKAPNEPSK